MKKLTVFLLILTLSVCSFCLMACGKKDLDSSQFSISDERTFVYDGQKHIIQVSAPDDVDVDYSVNDGEYMSAGSTNLVNAGNYKVKIRFSKYGYNDYYSNELNMKINPKPVTAVVENVDVLLEDATNENIANIAPRFSHSGVLDDEVLGLQFSVSNFDESNKVAGTSYEIIATATNKNYQLSSNTARMTLVDRFSVVNQNGVQYSHDISDALNNVEDNGTIKLNKDLILDQVLDIGKSVTLDGQNKFQIMASNGFASSRLLDMGTASTITLKDIVINANRKCRAVYINKGKLVIDNAFVTGGKTANSYIGGVYVTGNANFEMLSGSIKGNYCSSTYSNDNYKQYSADLWVGANAVASFATINDGEVGNVFVNSNSYSATNPGQFTMNGGKIDNIYVECSDGYGAKFVYVDGEINHLFVATGDSDGNSTELTPVKNTTYTGGQKY